MWLMCAVRYLFLNPLYVFGNDKQDSCVNLIRSFWRHYQQLNFESETVFGFLLSRCHLSKIGEIIPHEILVYGKNVIYYERDDRGIVYQFLFDSQFMLQNLKCYNRFNGPEQYCFWAPSLSNYLGVSVGPLSRHSLKDISQSLNRSIEVYTFSNNLPKLLYSEYTGNVESPIRVIQPFPDTKDSETVLIIFNPQILDFIPIAVIKFKALKVIKLFIGYKGAKISFRPAV